MVPPPPRCLVGLRVSTLPGQGTPPHPPGLGSASTEQALGPHSCYRILIWEALAFWACRRREQGRRDAWLEVRLS